MFRLRYTVSRSDFLAMRREQLRMSPWWQRWSAWVLFGVFGVICLGVGAFALLSPNVDRGTSAGGWILPAVFVLTGLLSLLERRWRRETFWRQVRAAGQIVVDVTPAGIGTEVGAERAFAGWGAFTHYRETPKLFLLYQGRTFFRYIPKSAFGGNEAGIEQMRQLLHTHVRLTRHPGRRRSAGAAFPVEAASSPPPAPVTEQ